MTQTSHLSSGAITNLDSIPVVPITTGEGAPGYLRTVNGEVASVSADAAGSTYRFVRIPTTAKVKHVYFEALAMTAGAVQLGVYYSDSTQDGTPPAVQGLVVPTVGVNFFANDINCAAAVAITDETNQNAAYPPDLRNEPLWQALGLTSDPGGYFDIVGTVHTTAVTAGAKMGLECQYVD